MNLGGLTLEKYEVLKFASLFHAIGKFYQRADNLNADNFSYNSKYNNLNENDYGEFCDYVKWSADFVKDYFNESVEDLVLYHQRPENSQDEKLCKIVKKASFYSSSEKINVDDENKINDSLLTSIFSKINLNYKKSDEKYVPLSELDFNKDLTPKNKSEFDDMYISKKYSILWDKFINEINILKSMDFETVLSIVKKYASTIPLNTIENSNDVSLYNHLKTTTSISNCLYLFSNEMELLDNDSQEVFKIINGDISGIQDFIYKISAPNDAQSGMNKRLRGRSLYLTLLNESIADMLINQLDLDSSNIIFCGGGRFTILAPNTSKTDEIIENINLEVNKYFISKFNAELYLALESIPASGKDLQNFDIVIKKLNNLLNINKKHKFSNLLEEIFDFKDEYYSKLCPVCGNPIVDFCKECNKHEELGQKIANAKFLIKYYGDISKQGFKFFDVNYIFENSQKNVINLLNSNSDVRFLVYKLNDTNFLDFIDEINNVNVSFDFKVLGNNVPNIGNSNKTLFFNHLAEISKGANKLGILKMDVDDLGLIFSSGFKDSENVSISRISSLSFYMDLFFSGYINKIASKFKVYSNTCGHDDLFEEIKLDFISNNQHVYKSIKDEVPNECEEYSISTIHINYSGGDDLLVLGPYDDIIQFSQTFRNEFKKWTANNDSVNISGGIFICDSKFPIGKAANLASDELEKSKDWGKNKITVFNEVLNWDSNGKVKGFDELFEFAQYLESKVGKGISISFVYSLLNIWQKSSKNTPVSFDGDPWENDLYNRLNSREYMRYFKYKLRIIKNRNLREEIDKKGVKYMPWIKTPVSWVSLRLR